MSDIDPTQHRREYGGRRLLESDVDADPLHQFRVWYNDAVEAGIDLPNAMTLATANARGVPSARMVLLKEADERGFVFYTNVASHKARELATNPRASLLFYWNPLDRQVRVTGTAETIPRRQAEAYFHSRPFESQAAAAASNQSRQIPARDVLEARFEELRVRFEADGRVPVPPDWGGYRVLPDEVEFWQGGLHRLHDRLLYRRDGAKWSVVRLAP
jgi:pyridoxamine 5'-phosphate oxidase